MKHSVSKKILLWIFFVMLLSIGITYLLIQKGVLWASDVFFGNEGRISAELVAEAYVENEYEYNQTNMKELCMDYNLGYAYIFVPNEECNKIRYLNFVQHDLIEEDYSERNAPDKEIETELYEEELAIWKGEKVSGELENTNIFGSYHTYVRGVYDKNGNCIAIAGVDILKQHINNTGNVLFVSAALIMTVVFALILFVIMVILRKHIFIPLVKIKDGIEDFVQNDTLNFEPFEVKGDDEFSVIGRSFNDVKTDIKNYIDTVSRMTAESEQQKAEMDVAAKIQQEMLPPNNCTGENIEISAIMKPSRTVGGDFYYYIKMMDGKWAAIIADVSGKGISAAMFMTRAITLLNGIITHFDSPSEILRNLNNALTVNNAETMFVTMFIAVFDEKKHTLTYSNAGHNPPLLVTKTGTEKLENATGSAIGLFEDEAYEEAVIQIQLGDILFLYTDGLTEALNEKREFFGEQRLSRIINEYEYEKHNTQEFIKYITDELNSFCGNVEQFDDITILVADFWKTYRLEMDAELSEIEKIKEIIIGNAAIPEKNQKQIFLAIEEIFVNIISYAYDETEKKGKVEIEIKLYHNSMRIKFQDDGKPYNPLENVYEPDEDDELLIGGMGKFLAFSIMEKQDYKYENGRNILILTKENLE